MEFFNPSTQTWDNENGAFYVDYFRDDDRDIIFPADWDRPYGYIVPFDDGTVEIIGPRWDWLTEMDESFAAQLFREKSPEALPTGDSVYFELIRHWLEACDRRHSCGHESKFWPTRVIYVGVSDPSELKLLETKSGYNKFQEEGYVALSHCWGNPTSEEKRNFCTTRENYQTRLNGFSIDNLPKTFQDAVQVTRAIGKKFLWIDALCIIQEDDDDWNAEAKSMEEVFSSAYCTIAADSSINWKQGFLERKSPP